MNKNLQTVFPWSPLTQRKPSRDLNKNESNNSTREVLYPDTDAAVWLRSCEKEILEPLNGSVSGIIPSWLNGVLIRNGPGSLKVGNDEFRHLFDSSALLHRFSIQNGNVTYQCKFLETEVYKKNRKANRIVITEFGTSAVPDPCHTIYRRVASIFHKDVQSDNANISVYPFGDELYAFGETPVIYKINKNDLNTEKRTDIGKYVSIIHHTSHPHVLEDGTVYNLGMSMTITGPHHNIICFPSKKLVDETSMFESAELVASIPARWKLHPSYMHTFGITENYFIIVEQPLSLSLASVLKRKFQNEPLAGAFCWYHDTKTQINILSRRSGKRTHTFLADAFFYLHIINQYEEGDYIILDICCYRDPSMLDCMYVEAMKNMQYDPEYAKMFRGRPLRFVLPLNSENVESDENLIKLGNSKATAYKLSNSVCVNPELLCNMGCETPRINYERYLGKSYQYFYAIGSDVDAKSPGMIIKIDTVNKTKLTWYEKNCYPSEPVFVGNPNGKSEDNGIILSSLVWGQGDTNRAGLLILDAENFKEIGRCEFRTHGPVPKCLHGWFMPD